MKIVKRELFRMEHKKLWRKTGIRISVFLCFTYVVIFGTVLSFQWFALGSRSGYSTAFGNHFDGYSVIKDSQEYTQSFTGDLTDETLQQLVRDYQRMSDAGMDEESQRTDYLTINIWLEMLWPELKDSANYNQMISYVDPEGLTGLYERRQQAMEEFLENNNQTGREKEYILKMEEKVGIPFRYDWTQGWSILLGEVIGGMGAVMALFLAIPLSSIFSGEWHDNTGALIMTTKNGWQQIAYVKICTGIAFTAELFAVLTLGILISQWFFLGAAGWDTSIQNIKMLAVAPMNMLQAEIYELAFTFLGAVGYAGIVMLLSAAIKSNVLALLLSLAVAYAPSTVARYLPYGAQKAMDLIPLAGSGADIFRTNTFHILGKYIWSPYLLITVPVLIGMICIPFTAMRWSRRLKV